MKSNCLRFFLCLLCLLMGTGTAVYKSQAADAFRGRITAGVNLRAAPGLAGKVITGLEKGSVITVTGEQGGWYQMTYEDDAYGYRGWVYGKYVERFTALPADQSAAMAPVAGNRPAPIVAVVQEPVPPTAGPSVTPLPPDMPANTIEQMQASAAPVQSSQPQPPDVAPKPARAVAAAPPLPTASPMPPADHRQATSPAYPHSDPGQNSGPGTWLSLLLKLTSVCLSCLALMISYRTFTLVSTRHSTSSSG